MVFFYKESKSKIKRKHLFIIFLVGGGGGEGGQSK